MFSVHEQVGALREFVSKHLGNNFGVFVFNDSGVKIDDDTKSLAEYGLVPAAALHFDWDEETMVGLSPFKPHSPAFLRLCFEAWTKHPLTWTRRWSRSRDVSLKKRSFTL